ncbi:MAG: YlxR family protein [Clostridiales bacterium]|jgi:predicted RNA-binding protein YlxR (DUF448 family)|nr:YlxR family protein [Clostridiales bacterium]
MAQKKIPLRMCIACREMKEKKGLLRIVRNGAGEVSLDFKGKAQGRGAYVCDNADCIKKCVKKKLLNKIFSCEIPNGVYAYIEKDYAEAIRKRSEKISEQNGEGKPDGE